MFIPVVFLSNLLAYCKLVRKMSNIVDQDEMLQNGHLVTLCMLGNFSCFRCRLLTFFKVIFSKDSFRNTIRVSNSLDPDQDRHSFDPDLGLNCVQWLLAINKVVSGKERVK